MASLEEFRRFLHDGDTARAFSDYELDFNSVEFDIFGSGPVEGYETEIVWCFEEPNRIKMIKKTASDGASGKKIYYLPWASKAVTSVQLDDSSPAYFVTSHLSNCRFTIKYHDDSGKRVTVMHVAGDVKGGALIPGSGARDKLEESVKVPEVKATRRLSVGGLKQLGKTGRAHMEAKAGTTYYDSYARVFGIRKNSGSWVFYVQNFNHEGKILGFKDI